MVNYRWWLPAMAAMAMMLVAAGSARAETQRVTRDFDRTLDFGTSSMRYGALGVGDFNGDGYDDLVFQGVSVPIGVSSVRELSIMLGPFDDVSDGFAVVPATTLKLSDGAAMASLAVADVNKDGMDDLTIAMASRSGLLNKEQQRVSIVFGREVWESYQRIGEASRGDRRIERRTELSPGMSTVLPSNLTVRWADLNADEHLDLVLAIDPPDMSTRSSRSGSPTSRTATAAVREGNSRIAVMYGDSRWKFHYPADPELGIPASEENYGFFRDDVLVEGLGQCERSLAGVADVTGDGWLDIVTRRCAGNNIPDKVGLVAGRADLASTVTVRGAIPDRPPPDPERPPTPPPMRRGYYSPPDMSIPGTLFARIPSAMLEDLNDDGVADVAFEFSDKTHVFLGGADIEERILDSRTDRVFVRAGTAGLALSQSWKRFDADGDGTRDLMLTLIPDDRLMDPFGQDGASGRSTPETVAAEPIHLFTADRLNDDRVLDLARDPADYVWYDDPAYQPWALGDFNGDGHEDMLLGTVPTASESIFPVLFGPFVR